MLPDDWKKEIEEAVGKATSAATDAENRRTQENNAVATRVDALADQMRRYNDREELEAPAKKRRERLTIGALCAAALFTLALAGFTAWQAWETRQALGPIKKSADAAFAASETTRAEISPYLAVLVEPQSKITLADDGAIVVDLYIANTGQTSAREMRLDVAIAMNPPDHAAGVNLTVHGDHFEATTTTPLHANFRVSPNIQNVLAAQGHGLLNVEIHVTLHYQNIFKEALLQTIDLKGVNLDDLLADSCCTIDQLKKSVPLVRPVDRFVVPRR